MNVAMLQKQKGVVIVIREKVILLHFSLNLCKRS